MRSVQFRAGGISKRFGGSKALDGADLEVWKGEVHGLVGENGAGKSTLVKIIAGAVAKDAGDMVLLGEHYAPHNPRDAYAKGIAVVHQHLSLVPGLTVADNIFLGRYGTDRFGFVKRRRLQEEATQLLERLGANDIPPNLLVSNLTTPKRYLVEIAKALLGRPSLVILDEPTASLGDRETKALFKTVHELVAEGRSVIWITHRLEELDAVASRITIMRDGKTVDLCEKSRGFDRDTIIKSMTGRADIREGLAGRERVPKSEEAASDSDTVMEFRGVSTEGGLKDLSFGIKKGEILAISGLVGCGMERIAGIFCGRENIASGSIEFKDVAIKSACSPRESARLGVFHLPADRAQEGIFPRLSVSENMTVSALREFSGKSGFVKQREVRQQVRKSIRDLSVRPLRPDAEMRSLSGGNQQKVVFARGVIKRPKIAILEEPTQGVDVGAKAEIYLLLEKWCELGTAVLIISTDTREVITVPDRVLSMYRGGIVAEFERGAIEEEQLIRSYFGANE